MITVLKDFPLEAFLDSARGKLEHCASAICNIILELDNVAVVEILQKCTIVA